MKLKNIILKNNRGNTPNYQDNEKYKNYPIINQSCVQSGYIKFEKLKYNKDSYLNKKGNVKKGDILICSTGGGTAGRVGFWNYEFKNYIVDSHVTLLRVKNKYNSKYIYYYLNSLLGKEYIRKCIKGSTNQEELSNKELNNFIFDKLPELKVQNKISSFLDENCSKIDTEVSLLEKKSKLLEEYKQSLIFETVTKGLDKNAEMKDSGIKFIGIIPNNWRIFRIKDLFNISRGRVIAASTLEKDSSDILKYPVFSAATENDGIIGYLERYDFNNNLLTWTTDGAKAGAVFIRSGKFNCTNVCGILRAKYKNNNLKFQKYALSIQTQNYQRPDINGAKIMSNEMANILIAQPELYEQTLISNFLDIETKKIEDEIKLINKKIELLKEYKQSLIYEAVTGQLEI